MAESDLYMQCDEDDLEPCQSFADNREQIYNEESSGNSALIPIQSDGTSEATSATADLTNQAVPVMSASAGTLLPSATQPAGVAGGQTIFIRAQPNPGQSLGGSMSLGTSLGYFLNGQPISFLTSAQTPQLIAPRMVTPASSARQATPGKISTLQIPVTLTINNPSNLQSITSTAPGVTNLNMTPSNILPATNTGTTIKVIKLTKLTGAPAAAGQGVSSFMQPNKAVTIQSNITNRAPAPLLSGGLFQVSKPAPAAASNALKRGFNSSKFCVRCKAFYQRFQSLRGYYCQCNQELIKSIRDLTAQARKRIKRPSDKTHSNPSTSKTPVSFSASSETSLKHVTTSEIPEGAPNPRSGDFDEQGRMIMLVEDFFYGQHPGQPAPVRPNAEPVTMKCQLCDKKVKGNIKLMNHTKHHMELERQTGEVDFHTMCQHCYRNFSTPFRLQCHVETVHNKAESSKVCKICEWSFENEPLFLNHMKHAHKPGEMPYMCQVCEFRSSFYEDVISHFAEKHKNTCILMCPFCLKVFRSCGGFQMHFTRHQKKAARHCDRCRLQFIHEKDEWQHRQKFHRTFVKPKQLEGLVPGTRVTIRAYADRTDNRDHLVAPPLKTPINTTSTFVASQNVTNKVIPTKKKPVESMVELMVKFQSQCKPTEKHFCMECNYDIPYFSNHFPTYVSCSLCRYNTCCSRAYANHMISVHVPRKNTKKYITLYKPCPKKGRLSCTTCRYKTQVGDLMAKHLADYPNHQSSHCTIRGFSRGYKRFVFIPTDLLRGGRRLNNRVFLPLQVKQVDGSSFPLSSNPLPRPSYTITLPASPAFTPSLPILIQSVEPSSVPDKICQANPSALKLTLNGGLSEVATKHAPEKLFTVAQLKVVLYALCCGFPQAANHFDTPPEEVQSLLLKRQHQIDPSGSQQGLSPQVADSLIEWVLCQREQQLPIDESNLFGFISSHGVKDISYNSMVDFLLCHDLGLQAFATSSKSLPYKSQELENSFSSFLKKQVTSKSFGLSSVGAMDELSIFVDTKQLDEASADLSSMLSAFTLMGTTDPLIDVVFTALADGTTLPTMVFLRGEPLKEQASSLPDFFILEARPEGFTDEERLQLWLDKVWCRHINPSFGGKGLLIMDTYKGHMSNEFLVTLNSVNTLPGLIPRSCSRRLQPLEACMGPVLREFMQTRWSEHVTKAPRELVGAKSADLALLLSRWLIEVLEVLIAEPKLLFRSFDQVLSTNPEEPSELVQSFTEALLVNKLQGDKVEQKAETSSIISAESLSSPQSSMLALRKLFEKDSDVESFHGFEESEILDHLSQM
ncbi:pogo transposable element derived with ZNF domain a isoform X2 [Puntigrus tetrazona]|uniref:pogo transposable element derived with ZNF domain a isoform X2 n=1 Tax=Puntigrus tetrazona TaxID=1606681 RepID=UPI001C89DA22|nr:pogo transposable element derived with ZNF domain a isoform X2 [Puntigrus tetrazona]